ncbi:MAG: helix-turn-helix transcriptional regulator [Polyangiaceae bacterium]|nr:helix-turn-helix transcriptional regulator [Polyangiaceae bacterium]
MESRATPAASRDRCARHGRARQGKASYPAGLSQREVEVLTLLANGLSTKVIADRLDLAPKTAENHIGHIYEKTGARGRAARPVCRTARLQSSVALSHRRDPAPPCVPASLGERTVLTGGFRSSPRGGLRGITVLIKHRAQAQRSTKWVVTIQQ